MLQGSSPTLSLDVWMSRILWVSRSLWLPLTASHWFSLALSGCLSMSPASFSSSRRRRPSSRERYLLVSVFGRPRQRGTGDGTLMSFHRGFHFSPGRGRNQADSTAKSDGTLMSAVFDGVCKSHVSNGKYNLRLYLINKGNRSIQIFGRHGVLVQPVANTNQSKCPHRNKHLPASTFFNA